MSHDEIIERAKGLIERSFSEEMKSFWTEGTIDAALNLCINAGGFAIGKRSLFACFRYQPKQYKAVEDMDWAELAEMDLRTGPLVHVVAMIEPKDGFRRLRALTQMFNAYAISAHRWNPRVKEWRFTVKRNVRFVDPRGEYGQFRQHQEQEQKPEHV